MRYPWSIAAATAVANFEVLNGQGGLTASIISSNRWRGIAGIGLAGSAQPFDYEVQIRVNQTTVGTYRNTRGGANTAPNNDDFQSVGGYKIPPGARVGVYMVIAPTTNPTNGFIDLIE